MKTKVTLIVFALFMLFVQRSQAQAYQIPNGGFETWDSVQGEPLNPAGWASYESIFGMPLGLSARDSGIIGKYSVKLTTDTVQGQKGTFAGIISLGTGQTVSNIPTFYGTPFAYRPDTFFFAYKYSSPGIDTPFFDILLTQKDAGAVLAVGGTLPGYTSWTLEYLALDSYYLNNQTPDTLLIQFYSSDRAPVIGSTLHVDYLFFGYKVLPAAIQEEVDKLNLNVYPNPANNVINITSAEDITGYKMLVTNISGQLVDERILTGHKSTIDVSRYAGGTYIYRIADRKGNIFSQDKFMVVK